MGIFRNLLGIRKNKEKIAAFEVGNTLYDYYRGKGWHVLNNGLKTLPELKAHEKLLQTFSKDKLLKINYESLFLTAFCTDYGIQGHIENLPMSNAILKSYYSRWDAKVKELNKPKMAEELRHKIVNYTNAIKMPHQNGPAWTVGKAFSEHCGFGMNAEIILLGGLLFTSHCGWVVESLKQIKDEFEIVVESY